MSVSIVMPFYNAERYLRDTLGSVLRAAAGTVEVIAVSDASTDGSDDLARTLGARVLRLEENAGPSRARNRGAREACGEILLFIDADVSIPSGILDRVREAFRADPRIEALFGSYDDAPAAPNFASQYRNLLHHHVHQTGNEAAVTFWAGFGAVRRETFLRLGGFDESRRYLEDVELGHRLTRAGCTIRLDPTLQVKHHKKWTVGSMMVTDVVHRAFPWTDLIWAQGSMPRDLNVRPSRRFAALLVLSLPGWLLLAAIAHGVVRAGAVSGFALSIVLQLAVDRPFYTLLYRKRGLASMIGGVICHWIYYVSAAATYSVSMAYFVLTRRKRSAEHPLDTTLKREPIAP